MNIARNIVTDAAVLPIKQACRRACNQTPSGLNRLFAPENMAQSQVPFPAQQNAGKMSNANFAVFGIRRANHHPGKKSDSGQNRRALASLQRDQLRATAFLELQIEQNDISRIKITAASSRKIS